MMVTFPMRKISEGCQGGQPTPVIGAVRAVIVECQPQANMHTTPRWVGIDKTARKWARMPRGTHTTYKPSVPRPSRSNCCSPMS